MKYYVYFNAYGHARRAISEKELAESFQNNPDNFMKVMTQHPADAAANHFTGHVGVLNFETEQELLDYLESLGDEITGFYGCRSDSRPYNF